MFIQLLSALIFLVLTLFVLFSGMSDVSFVCKLNFLPTYCWFGTSHVIFNNPNSSISDIPGSAGLSLGTTKNLQLTTISLCFNQTEEMSNCSISELLHVLELLICSLLQETILLLPLEIEI